MQCAWFPSHTFEPKRFKPGNIGNWSGHLSFAHDLIVSIKPSLFVELGTHLGESYFGCCQAIAENNVSCLAYAIDTWQGEAHAGFYDEEVYDEVLSYNQANFSNFSYLIRSLFDTALPSFAAESIDLLHIDGLHTFEAASHDFYSWLPKLKPGGIVLLHDIVARHQDFGVWQLWDSLKSQGNTFEFHHSWGLGVFQKPGADNLNSELLKALFDGDTVTQAQVRRAYFLLSLELAANNPSTTMPPKVQVPLKDTTPPPQVSDENHCLRVYFPLAEGYSEAQSKAEVIVPGQWQYLLINLPKGANTGPYRLDVTNRPAICDIREVIVRSALDQTIVWRATGADTGHLTPGGTLIQIRSNESEGASRFFSYGRDPQLYLPQLNQSYADQPLLLELWIRLQTELNDILPILADNVAPNHAEPINAEPINAESINAESINEIKTVVGELKAEITDLKTEVGELVNQTESERQLRAQEVQNYREANENELQTARLQLTQARSEQEKLLTEVHKKQTHIYILDDAQKMLKETEERSVQWEQKYETLNRVNSELQYSARALQDEYDKLKAVFTSVLQSRSWRVTEPLRKFMGSFKG